MNRSRIWHGFIILLLGFIFGVIPAIQAQTQGSSQPSPKPAGQAQEAPKVNPQEQADYRAFFGTQDPDKKIQLGQAFVQKYPMSQYVSNVYTQLVVAYYGKQDWTNFYATGDKAIAKDPDNVDVLTIVGWMIPHENNSGDADADKKLEKAEAYEKHALELIPNLPKPANMSDDAFASAKGQKLSQAHSGLGLAYFRQGDADDAVKELQQATQAAGSADPTDFYVLGVELQRLKRNSEAADAYQKCSEIPGGLQDRCKQSTLQAKAAK